MRIADLHCDVLYKLDVDASADCDVTEATLREGGVALQVFAAFCAARKSDEGPFDIANRQLDRLRGLLRAWPSLRMYDGAPMDGLIDGNAQENGIIRAIAAIEGGEALEGSIERLEHFARRGVRIVTLVWNHENELGYPASSGSKEGLKPAGKRILRRMIEMGVAADVSHLNEAGFWDVAEAGAPILASHSNAYALMSHPRNLTDAQLKAVAASGGLVGLNFYPPFLAEGGADIADIARHAAHMAEVMGAEHLAFGSDFDGIEIKTRGVRDPGDFPAVLDALRVVGFDEVALEGVGYLNAESFFMGG